jgi:chromosome segregation ATPase
MTIQQFAPTSPLGQAEQALIQAQAAQQELDTTIDRHAIELGSVRTWLDAADLETDLTIFVHKQARAQLLDRALARATEQRVQHWEVLRACEETWQRLHDRYQEASYALDRLQNAEHPITRQLTLQQHASRLSAAQATLQTLTTPAVELVPA